MTTKDFDRKMLVRPVFFNKKTGQASITLPVKLLKFLKEKPKEVRVEIREGKIKLNKRRFING